MAMQIETYEIQEAPTNLDDSAEAQELIEKLGLEAQKELFKSPEKMAAPYRKMTAEERVVYEAILPKKCEAHDFNDCVIPVRVLQVLAHAKDLQFFDRFYIWACETAKDDPLLLGFKRRSGPDELYMLARWAEVLESFEILKGKALVVLRDKYRAKYEEIAAKMQQNLATINTRPLSAFNGTGPYYMD